MKFLTVQEVADRLRLCPDTVYQLLRARKLRGHKIATGVFKGKGSWRVSEDALAEYVKSTEVMPP
jgi:excisionase family DNA binding protein